MSLGQRLSAKFPSLAVHKVFAKKLKKKMKNAKIYEKKKYYNSLVAIKPANHEPQFKGQC